MFNSTFWNLPIFVHTLWFNLTGFRLVQINYNTIPSKPDYIWTKRYPLRSTGTGINVKLEDNETNF